MKRKPDILLISNDQEQNPLKKIIKDLSLEFNTCDFDDDQFAYISESTAIIIIDSENSQKDKTLKTVESLRKRSSSRNIPVLFFAGDKEDLLIFDGYEKAPVDYLFKPLEIEIARAKIEFFLNLRKAKVKYTEKKEFAESRVRSKENGYSDLHPEKDDILDNLSGLYNQSHMLDVCSMEFDRAKRYNLELSCMVIDIDSFRDLNENFGYGFGNFVIGESARILKTYLRSSDQAFRYGGEEFLVLLPETDIDGAKVTAEKIRTHFMENLIKDGDNESLISISIGITSIENSRPRNYEELMVYACRALSQAKENGRNNVAVYKENVSDYSLFQGDIIVLRNRIERILERTKSSAISSIETLVRKTGGSSVESHNQRVLKFIELVGEKMRMPESIVDPFKRAAVLHDCFKYLLGKTMVTENPLTPEEKAVVESYPYMLAELTELFDFFANERSVLLFHHENFDGSGYPEGLKGAEIPLGARIFAIADSVVAMLSERPYREGKSIDEVKEELGKNAGKQFDPNLIEIFISILNETEDSGIFYE